MKEKIKEVQDYFKKKILESKFKITTIDRNSITLIIDNYSFYFLVSVICKSAWTIQYDHKLSFIDLGLTAKERVSFHAVLSPIVKNYIKTALITEKEAELKKLKAELK